MGSMLYKVSSLPEEHPWTEYPRWRMALHTLAGVILSGTAGGLLVGVTALPNLNDYATTVKTGTLAFGVILGVVCAALAAALGRWLRKFYPFSQALLFGAITITALFLIALIVGTIERIVTPAEADATLFPHPVMGAAFLLVLLGIPVFLASAIGYAFAVWSPTPRGTRVFWPLLIAVAAAAGIVMTLQLTGAFSGYERSTDPQPNGVAQEDGIRYGDEATVVRPGVCSTVDGKGDTIEFPCDGLPFDEDTTGK